MQTSCCPNRPLGKPCHTEGSIAASAAASRGAHGRSLAAGGAQEATRFDQFTDRERGCSDLELWGNQSAEGSNDAHQQILSLIPKMTSQKN